MNALREARCISAEDVLATGVDFDHAVIPILHTGWTDRTWGNDDFWDSMPYPHPSVSDLMVERGVSAVAFDFFSEVPFWRLPRDPAYPPSPNHLKLLGNNITLIQLLTNVAAIDADDFLLVAAPLRLEGLDGAPARVFAIIDPGA